MKRPNVILIANLLLAVLLLSPCPAYGRKDAVRTHARERLRQMTLRQKVGQLFVVRLESLQPKALGNTAVTLLTDEIRQCDEQYPVGGIILFAKNCVDPRQMQQLVPQIKALQNTPLVCIDEEGGLVARLANNTSFGLDKYTSMTWLCQHGGQNAVYRAADYIGSYLSSYGIDIDFAPVSDVNSNPDNPVIGARAFSADPDSVGRMVCSYLDGLRNHGIIGCLKHFPGHGDTKTDTHLGYTETKKTWKEMKRCEMIPFRAGIRQGVQLIMSAHITAPRVDKSNVPSTLSSVMLRKKLRGRLRYKQLIITDGMEMGAITKYYSAGEAAVKAIQAGADLILGPLNYLQAFDAVVDAVQSGQLSERRIDQSVLRILMLKESRPR